MVGEYTRADFEDFMRGMSETSQLVQTLNPSIFLVTLNGGQPLFDVLSIMNRNVDTSSAVYFPVSSKIQNSERVTRNCFINFLLERHFRSDSPQQIVSLDEIVSGGSVCKILGAYDTALREVVMGLHKDYDRDRVLVEAEKLRRAFPLHIIGLKEQRVNPKKAYLDYVANHRITEIPVNKIVTMDDPEMAISVFDHPHSTGWSGQGYFPRVVEYRISEKYLNFLKDVASYCGVDPADVQPTGLGRIKEHSERYSKKPNFELEQ